MASEAAVLRPAHATRPPRVILVLAGLVALGFVSGFVVPYLTLDQTRFGPFWPRRWWLLAHLAPGTVALLIAPVQVWLGTTRRRLDVHRMLGRLYLVVVALSSAASIGLAVQNDVGWVYALGLLGLATAWLTTTGMAWLAIRRRHVEQHREWMIRSVVVTFAFVWFRIVLGSTIAFGIGTETERFVVAAWTCWSMPLLITEVCLQARRLGRLPARI